MLSRRKLIMSMGVYSNNYIHDKYAVKDNASFSNNEKENDSHSSFYDEFSKEESDERRAKAQLDREDRANEHTSEPEFYSSHPASTIHDYLDNFLLINAEQVACSNMTQHLIRSDKLKVTLGFLNTKASEQVFAAKKRPNFEENKHTPQFKNNSSMSTPDNFFSTGTDASTNNFFMSK